MDFTIDREHELLRKMYREFAETEVKPLQKKSMKLSVSPKRLSRKWLNWA